MKVDFDFEPPIVIQPGCAMKLDLNPETGRANIEVRCMITTQLIESRCDCQLLNIDGRQVLVAAPGSIRRPKLSWKVRLLRWLAKG